MRKKIRGRRKEIRMYCEVSFTVHGGTFSDTYQILSVAGPNNNNNNNNSKNKSTL